MPANSSTFRQVRTISSLLLLALACALAASAGLLAQEKGLSSEKRAQIEKAVSAFMRFRRRRTKWPAHLVRRLRHVRPRRLHASDFLHAVPPRLDFETHYRRRHPATLRTRQARSRRSRAKILPLLPPERLAHHLPPASRASRRHPPLQQGRQRRRP